MGKSITYGNGSVLVGLDKYGQVSDFYFPYVGLENQSGGNMVHKMGIYIDGELHWVDDGTWNVEVTNIDNSLGAKIKARHNYKQIQLDIEDIVYNERNIFVRKIFIQNLSPNTKTVKFFYNQQYQLNETVRGDSGYYDPIRNAIVHYEGRRIFFTKAECDGKPFDDYSVGLYGIEGKEGTYKDAEDGVLTKNPIEHGLVDSVIGFTLDLKPQSSKLIYYWTLIAKTFTEIYEMYDYVETKTPQYLMDSSKNYWSAWVNKQNFSFYSLEQDIIDLFKKSLLTIRSHVDNEGAIIASGDSDLLKNGRDYYCYVWMRDASYAAIALDQASYYDLTRKFFEFANSVITDEGYFMHKYRSDQALGSSWHPWIVNGVMQLPIQEDETALVLIALWEHYMRAKDIEFIESVYNSLIKKAAEFLTTYIDIDLNLPKPSYDLWEEKRGVSTFTASTVYGGLIAAAKFAKLLGKKSKYEEYTKKAEDLKISIYIHLFDEATGMFYKLINKTDKGLIHDSTVDASSVYGIFNYDVLDIDNKKLENAVKMTEEKLSCKTEVGGIARYEGDNYFKTYKDQPGNPWIVTSLWLAQYYIKKAKNLDELEQAKKWIKWTVTKANSAGILPEQIDPFSKQAVSVAPLTWSHSEFVSVIINFLEKLEKFGICKVSLPMT